MKVLETKEKGGELVKESYFFGSVLDFPKEGETTVKTKTTTYEGVLQIPFKVEYEETIEPALDVKGKPKKGVGEPRICGLSIELPFESYGGKGVITFHAYNYSGCELDENQLGQAIVKALGDEIFSYKLPRKREDD